MTVDSRKPLKKVLLLHVLVSTVLLSLVGVASADRIYLKHGGYVETDSWREEGEYLYYRRLGGEIGIPKADVLRIERRPQDLTGPPAPPKTAAPAPTKGCAQTVVTAGDLKRTEELIEIFIKTKQRDVEQHLRTCLAMQRRAQAGESITTEQMAGACCA